MAVRILKGQEVLKEAFGLKENSVLLLEWYKTQNTPIKQIANQFIYDWIDWVVKLMKEYRTKIPSLYKSFFPDVLKNPQKRYDYLAAYFYMLPFTSANKGFKFVKTYFVKKYKFKDETIQLRISYGTKDIRTLGFTRHNKSGKSTITIRFHNNDLSNYFVTVGKEGKILYNEIERIVSKLKRTAAHEITHFIQHTFKGSIKHFPVFSLLNGKQNLWSLSFSLYFMEEHELEAMLNEAYKLYTEKGNFITKKERKTKKKDFFTCLLFELLDRFDFNSNLVLTGKLSFWDVLVELNKIKRYHDLFLMLWVIYYYVPEKSKFKHIMHLPSDAPKVNKELLENNRKNLINFLNSFTPYGITVLNRIFSKIDENEVLRRIFAVSETNEQILDKLTELVEK